MTKCSHDVFGYIKPLPTDAAITTTQIQCANCDKVGEAIVTLDWHEVITSAELGALEPGATIEITHNCELDSRACKQYLRLVQHAHRKFGKGNYTGWHRRAGWFGHESNELGFTRIR